MKIAHVIVDLGVHSGGPTRSVLSTVQALIRNKVNVDILTYASSFNKNICDASYIRTVNYENKMPFAYNYEFKELLTRSSYDLYHVQCIFTYPTYIVPRYAFKRKIPYIITPRGSLYEHALKVPKLNWWKKKIYLKTILIPQLQHATVIQATCMEEMNEIRKLGVSVPIAVIPNPLKLPKNIISPSSPDKKRIGFVGRIDEKKNIDGLLEGWHLAGLGNRDDVELVIVGGGTVLDDKKYFAKLHKMVSQYNLNNVVWAGALYDDEKREMIRTFSYLIMPSHNENFGMVVPEALIEGVPVIASKGAPWSILEKSNSGFWIDVDPTTIAKTLQKALILSEEERLKMGNMGQKLVIEKFSEDKVAGMLIKLYQWILEGVEKPDFVYC